MHDLDDDDRDPYPPPWHAGREAWRPVIGYEGWYEVSDQGRVRSVDRWIPYRDESGRRSRFHRGKILAVDTKGRYPRVTLRRHQHFNKTGIHQLVCAAFHGPCPSWATEIRHLNGDAFDARPENLAWGTHSENMQDKIRHGNNHLLTRDHCPRGHGWTEENTYRPPNGRGRICRECTRITNRAAYHRRKAVNPGA
ncbi:NUMOD4 motif protein [Mycobacterium marinum]|uniref:NUMOD4 motif-containing HNH endonuclease n=1 Tax=Mycobacterium marinum TaxID=1781 RepID=UPI000E28AAA2|nr:NUMOD4 motif-containing HNH endonuclease [Mycobacterium marinum]AXN43438.1 NUMOD4 motif protein [Mycobacterium marinum]RFZ11510.1 NUMOD4 motif protein [Mycobacterium marinum]